MKTKISLVILNRNESVEEIDFEKVLDSLNKSLNKNSEEWQSDNNKYTICKEEVINKSKYRSVFEMFVLKEKIYFNLEVEGKTKNQTVLKITDICNSLLNTQNGLARDYLLIKSYDGISEYYCNKISAQIASYERVFRNLLINIYIYHNGRDYIQKIEKGLDSKTIGKINGRIGASKKKGAKKKEGHKISQYIANLTYDEIEKMLFSEYWDDKDELLELESISQNIKGQSISIKEFKQYMQNRRPKSNWERYFLNSIRDGEIQKEIYYIREQRNKIAHNKDFSLGEFNETKRALKKLIKTIEEAIEFTEKSEFNPPYNSMNYSGFPNWEEVFLDMNTALGAVSTVITEVMNNIDFSALRNVVAQTTFNPFLISDLNDDDDDYLL